MKATRRWLAAACAASMLLCSGCSLLENSGDLAEQLRPPRLTGQQETLQQALDDYVTDDYVLTYPRSGDHRSAFLLQDMDGDGTDEAICFYRLSEGNTHVLLLRREGEGWKPQNDLQGSSVDIDWVAFGDMRGNGGSQLLVGWGIYNNDRDRQVILYDQREEGLSSLFDSTCAAAYFGDVMKSGRDTLLLYHIDDGNERVTASLTTSSTTCSSLWRLFSGSAPMRVMLRRFSTMFMSHSASERASYKRFFYSFSSRTPSSSVTAFIAPIMLVSGVRKSWEIARRRFARIFSLSASIRSCSLYLTLDVSILAIMDTPNIHKNVSGYPIREKLKSK